ncbi:pyridoxal-dependent decarboxylase conserved domain-containing protein [Delphinella strobiligena]|nr:pyridoxal-dependent decarboxylase conserved domain-containing protein [Delphinella strobiligena]
MTSDQFTRAAHLAVSDISSYYDELHSRQVVPSIEPGYLRKLLPSSAPQVSESWDDIRSDIESKIMPGITHWQSPNFMAFFPASSTYPGILGEMWSAALTAPAFNWLCSPAVTELETIVLDWLAQMLALPEAFHSHGTGGGAIQGSASEAIVTVMVAARERYIRNILDREGITDEEEKEDRACELRGKLVALGSNQAHSSTQKAANITGTRFRSIQVSRENNLALTAKELREKIEILKAKGLEPYYLTVTLGTTNTCAVDDFESIAAVKKDYPDLWIHVDAAYAGAALVCEEYQHLAKSMATFDSFDMNMHKWLLTNFDASCLFVQNRKHLTDALSITPAYLRNTFSDKGLVTDYRDWQIPLGRRFRALKIWFVIRTWGVEGLKAHIRHHIKLGELFVSLVKSRSDLFSILVPPSFALTVLTVNPTPRRAFQAGAISNGADPRSYEDQNVPIVPKQSEEELKEANKITKEVYSLIDSRKEVFLTSSVVGGVNAIRVVSANPLAEEAGIRKAFDILVSTTEEVLASKQK